MDCSEVSSNGDVQDPEHTDLEQEQVRAEVRNPQNGFREEVQQSTKPPIEDAGLFRSQCGIMLVLQI